jgi:iron complex outermembrane receptor protein
MGKMKEYALEFWLRVAEKRQAASGHSWKLRAGVAAVIGALSMFASGQALAADELSTSDLQAENLRLRKEIEALKNGLKPGVPVAAAASEPAAHESGNAAPIAKAAVDENDVATLDQIVVRAREREENLQDVPIPVSAVSGKMLDRDDAVTIQDFAKLTPNILVQAPNARQTSISIRGVGKNTANDALEPSVGVVIDGVPSAFIADSWGDFDDLDHIEVLRGPQGTLMGKNTTLGVVNIVTKDPSFKPESTVQLSAGQYNEIGSKAVIGGPIQDGVLAYRLSVFTEKRNGPFQDVAPDHTDETFGDRNRMGVRAQFLLLPSPDLSVRLSIDRQRSSEMVPYGDPPLIGEPATFADGASRTAGTGTTFSSRLARPYFGDYQPLIGNWNQVSNVGSLPTVSVSSGVTANVNWTPQENLTLTSITAFRNSLFDAHNAAWAPFSIYQYGAIISQEQVSQEFHVNSTISKVVDYTAGVYLLDSTVSSTDRNLYGADGSAFYATNAQYNTLSSSPVGTQLMQDSLRGLFTNTTTHPDTKSAAEFGQLNWHLNEKATVTLGLRRTDETKTNDYTNVIADGSALTSNLQATTLNATGNAINGIYNGATAAQIAAAKNILSGKDANLGYVSGQEINATSYAWLVNPSYKLSENTLLYTSAGYGEKSGAVEFNTTKLTTQNVAPEKALDFELGFKTSQLNHALNFSANLYHTEITDYQQNLSVLDPTLTTQNGATTYRTYLGNVAGVTLEGLELDGSYAATERLRFNFSGAYNKAFYSDFSDAPCRVEISGAPGGQQQCNFTGKELPFAPRFSANLGFDYRTPIAGAYFLHAFSNVVYRGSANYNSGLSDVGLQGAYSIIDGGIGVQSPGDKFELTLVGKNLANTHYVTNIDAYSTTGAVTATPGDQRYVGLVLRARL